MPEYKVLKYGKEYTAPDIETLKRWVREGRIKPNNQVYHTGSQKWIYVKEIAELDEDLKKISMSKKSFARYFTFAEIAFICIGFLMTYYGFKNGSYRVGVVGAYLLVFGIDIFIFTIKRNKRTFLIVGLLTIILILSNVISYAWINRNVKIKKVTGVKCSSCKKVFSADTTVISIPVKKKAGRDFIFEYRDTLCELCKERIIQEADNLVREGKKEYRKGYYPIANAKFQDAKGKYSKSKAGPEKIKNVSGWLEKTSREIATKRKKEKEYMVIATRKAYEELARNAFLDKGWDIKVRVHGPKSKYITLTWALMGDIFVHNFEKSSMFQEMYDLGFRRVYYRDGYNFSKYTYWKD